MNYEGDQIKVNEMGKIYGSERGHEKYLQNSNSYCCKMRGINHLRALTLNIPSLARQRCLSSLGPRRTPWFFCNFSTVCEVDYSNYVFWVSETIIQ